MRGAIFFLLIMIVLAKLTYGVTTTPEALVPAAGLSEGAFYDNFAVLGNDVAGIIYSASYASGAGLAGEIFTPLLPIAGQPVPTISSSEGAVISYPNPFNPDNNQSVTISYKYSTDAEVKAMFFDITGQLVQTITGSSGNRGADGYSRLVWNGKSGFGETVESGVYLVAIIAGGTTIAKTKLLVMK